MNETERLAFLALLRRFEWSGRGMRYDDGSYASVCPVCRVPDRPRGHLPECELAACIRVLEK